MVIKKKNIEFATVVFAIMVFLLHSIIPHHHHLDNLSDHATTATSHATHGESSQEAATHCHAMNNLTFKMVTPFGNVQQIPVEIVLYVVADFKTVDIPSDIIRLSLCGDDIPLIQEATEKAFSAERYYDVTHRILTDKGNIRYVHQRAEVYWENECQKFAGTIQDITDLKRSQEMIDRLSQVVNQTPLSTIITDRDGVIEYVNNQTLKLTGYFSHELIGQKMNLFNSGRQPESFFQELWTTIAGKRSFGGERSSIG